MPGPLRPVMLMILRMRYFVCDTHERGRHYMVGGMDGGGGGCASEWTKKFQPNNHSQMLHAMCGSYHAVEGGKNQYSMWAVCLEGRCVTG